VVQFGGWVAGTGRDGAILGGHPELDVLLYCLQSMGGLWLASRVHAPTSRQGLDSLNHMVHAANQGGTVSMVRCILGLDRWKNTKWLEQGGCWVRDLAC